MNWSSLLLSAGADFGAAVWFVIGIRGRKVHPWYAFWYMVLGLSYLAAGSILGTRVFRLTVFLPPWVITLILSMLFIIPPALQLESWLKAQRLLRGR